MPPTVSPDIHVSSERWSTGMLGMMSAGLEGWTAAGIRWYISYFLTFDWNALNERLQEWLDHKLANGLPALCLALWLSGKLPYFMFHTEPHQPSRSTYVHNASRWRGLTVISIAFVTRWIAVVDFFLGQWFLVNITRRIFLFVLPGTNTFVKVRQSFHHIQALTFLTCWLCFF